MSEIIWHLSFFDWLISLSIIFSRSIHAAAKGKLFFNFMAEYYSIIKCTIAVLSTHLLMDAWAASKSWLL